MSKEINDLSLKNGPSRMSHSIILNAKEHIILKGKVKMEY